MTTQSVVHVEWDGDEPYIPVSDTIRITPARPNDVARWVELNNSPLVAASSWRHPIPYPEDLAANSIEAAMIRSKALIVEMREAPTEPVPGCPFDVIRQYPSGELMGTINLTVSDRPIDLPEPTPGSEVETHLTRYPWAKETWDVGYKVLPEFSGRGVASKALGALVEAWAIGLMRLRQVSAGSRATNSASHAVLRKNGFAEVYRYPRTDIRGNTFEGAKFSRVLA
ncbi:hypothetical protein EHS25_001099 [Saitozyma podzolica]|uniref:N-acetyltransferase domain-containing protein n=1 Tax=Saitozyma podzolica TaxID=1890683 RepID=A0A427YHQ0_9TREE|nr:hypothetical protein EHS25_001099 [Saitozyma podzolica]